MRELGGKRVPREAWEAGAASILLLWRGFSHPLPLWSDWFSILCAFWLFTALAFRTKAWPYVAGGVMAGLLVLYGSRQLPLTLGALGFGP